MVCPSCGNPVAGPGSFCTRCGVQVPYPAAATSPASPYASVPAYPAAASYARPVCMRVTRHLQVLGILWFVYGAYRAASGVFGAAVLAGLSSQTAMERWGLGGRMLGLPHGAMLGAMAGFVIVYTGISAALAFVTGYGLVTRAQWARILAIVAAILALFHPVSGTALGIYTLWVLAPSRSAAEYDALAERS